MERIVTDLLFLAVTDATTRTEEVRLTPWWTSTRWSQRRSAVRDCRLASRSGSPRTTAAPVRGRSDELCRLVRNLLDNAVHHAQGRVELTLDVSGSEVQLRVHDDGPGIPADQQERIFDRFWRAEAARSRTGGGTGLGLDCRIARSIAGRHGGALVVDGDGAGGCFVVTLPLAS